MSAVLWRIPAAPAEEEAQLRSWRFPPRAFHFYERVGFWCGLNTIRFESAVCFGKLRKLALGSVLRLRVVLLVVLM